MLNDSTCGHVENTRQATYLLHCGVGGIDTVVESAESAPTVGSVINEMKASVSWPFGECRVCHPRWRGGEEATSTAMHKLTSLEAQRVTSVLEDTLERLQALSYVPVMTNNNEDELLSSVDASQAKCLQTLWQLEENHRRSRDSAFSNNAYGE